MVWYLVDRNDIGPIHTPFRTNVVYFNNSTVRFDNFAEGVLPSPQAGQVTSAAVCPSFDLPLSASGTLQDFQALHSFPHHDNVGNPHLKSPPECLNPLINPNTSNHSTSTVATITVAVHQLKASTDCTPLTPYITYLATIAMFSTRSNSPSSPPGRLPLPSSPHSNTVEKYDMKGDKVDNTSSPFTYPPPAPTNSPIFTKKEKHPPEKISDYDFQSVEGFLGENHDETDALDKEESKDEQRAFPEPVVISTSITTTHVKDLHELCQSHIRLTPFFEFEQRKPQEFSVVLKLVGPEGTKEIAIEGTYPSKRHAKEAASGRGIQYVRDLPRNESLKSITLETLEKEDENWVGLLSGEDSPSCFRTQYIFHTFMFCALHILIFPSFFFKEISSSI